MIIANGWVKSVVEPLTIGKRAGAVAGESAVSTIHTVVPGVLPGCRVRPSCPPPTPDVRQMIEFRVLLRAIPRAREAYAADSSASRLASPTALSTPARRPH